MGHSIREKSHPVWEGERKNFLRHKFLTMERAKSIQLVYSSEVLLVSR